MKIKTMLGLAAIGGFAYHHSQRGGTWTLDSLKETATNLFGQVRTQFGQLLTQAQSGSSSGSQPLVRGASKYDSADLH